MILTLNIIINKLYIKVDQEYKHPSKHIYFLYQ